MNAEVTTTETASDASTTVATETTKPAEKAKKVRVDPKVTLQAIVDKLGTHGPLKSEHVYLQVSPHALEVLRKHGRKLHFGYYSLEHYFGIKKEGEEPTPVAEGTKIWKDRAPKAVASPEVVQAVTETSEAAPEVQVIESVAPVATIETVEGEQPPVVAVETQQEVTEQAPKAKSKKDKKKATAQVAPTEQTETA